MKKWVVGASLATSLILIHSSQRPNNQSLIRAILWDRRRAMEEDWPLLRHWKLLNLKRKKRQKSKRAKDFSRTN